MDKTCLTIPIGKCTLNPNKCAAEDEGGGIIKTGDICIGR